MNFWTIREAAATIVQAAPTLDTATDRVFTIVYGVTVTMQKLTIGRVPATNG